jgi:hypothetical protein
MWPTHVHTPHHTRGADCAAAVHQWCWHCGTRGDSSRTAAATNTATNTDTNTDDTTDTGGTATSDTPDANTTSNDASGASTTLDTAVSRRCSPRLHVPFHLLQHLDGVEVDDVCVGHRVRPAVLQRPVHNDGCACAAHNAWTHCFGPG